MSNFTTPARFLDFFLSLIYSRSGRSHMSFTYLYATSPCYVDLPVGMGVGYLWNRLEISAKSLERLCS